MFRLPSSALFLSLFLTHFIAFKILSLCLFVLSLFSFLLTCQVFFVFFPCQLPLNQPAECRKFRSLPPLHRGAGHRCVASANRHKVKRASPTFHNDCPVNHQECTVRHARSVPSIQRSAFLFPPLHVFFLSNKRH